MILKEFEEYANNLNIFKVGYTKIEDNKDPKLKFENVIILAIEMDIDIIKAETGEKAKRLNKAFYAKFRVITEKIAEYLINKGFETQIAYPNEILIDLPSLGEKAGIGSIGKSGLLITPEFGSRIKLAGILTSFEDFSFNYNNTNNSKINEKYDWIKEYCKECAECVDYCEFEALVEDSDLKTVNLIDSKCVGSEEGCTYCIEKCPFNEKGYDFVKNDFIKKI